MCILLLLWHFMTFHDIYLVYQKSQRLKSDPLNNKIGNESRNTNSPNQKCNLTVCAGKASCPKLHHKKKTMAFLLTNFLIYIIILTNI